MRLAAVDKYIEELEKYVKELEQERDDLTAKHGQVIAQLASARDLAYNRQVRILLLEQKLQDKTNACNS